MDKWLDNYRNRRKSTKGCVKNSLVDQPSKRLTKSVQWRKRKETPISLLRGVRNPLEANRKLTRSLPAPSRRDLHNIKPDQTLSLRDRYSHSQSRRPTQHRWRHQGIRKLLARLSYQDSLLWERLYGRNQQLFKESKAIQLVCNTRNA